MKKILLAGLIGFALVGCVSDVKYNYVPEITQKSYPDLNVVTTTYVGDDMVRQGNVKTMDVISFPVTTQVNKFWYSYIIDAGDYPKIGEDKKYLFFEVFVSFSFSFFVFLFSNLNEKNKKEEEKKIF